MEELKKDVISEEALDKISAGLKMPKSELLKALIAAGVTVLAAMPLAGVGAGAAYLIDKKVKGESQGQAANLN